MANDYPLPDIDVWRDHARCRLYVTSVFFPDSQQGIDRAKEICAACPVRQACLDDAMATEPRYSAHRFGVRGGLTATERHTLHRRQLRQANR